MADLTPTKDGYVRILKMILHHSSSKEDILWAANELDKVLGIDE